MPRITSSDVSNFSESLEPGGAAYIANHIVEPHWPPKHRVSVSAPDGVSEVVPPAQPTKSAPRAEWEEYAEASGEGDVPSKTKDELIEEYGSNGEEEGEAPSAGTSSSRSGKKRARSGGSRQDTGSSTQSPAPVAESPSGKDQPTNQVQSSSASSTDGSTRVTGPSRQSQSSSSDQPAQEAEATQDPSDPKA